MPPSSSAAGYAPLPSISLFKRSGLGCMLHGSHGQRDGLVVQAGLGWACTLPISEGLLDEPNLTGI